MRDKPYGTTDTLIRRLDNQLVGTVLMSSFTARKHRMESYEILSIEEAPIPYAEVLYETGETDVVAVKDMLMDAFNADDPKEFRAVSGLPLFGLPKKTEKDLITPSAKEGGEDIPF